MVFCWCAGLGAEEGTGVRGDELPIGVGEAGELHQIDDAETDSARREEKASSRLHHAMVDASS